MSKELPPELRPQLDPATRANSIAKARAKLDDLAAEGVDDAFLLHVREPDGMTVTLGSADLAETHLLAVAALHSLVMIASKLQQEHLHGCAEMAIAILGGEVKAQWGGVRTTQRI